MLDNTPEEQDKEVSGLLEFCKFDVACWHHLTGQGIERCLTIPRNFYCLGSVFLQDRWDLTNKLCAKLYPGWKK